MSSKDLKNILVYTKQTFSVNCYASESVIAVCVINFMKKWWWADDRMTSALRFGRLLLSFQPQSHKHESHFLLFVAQ